MRGDTLNSEAMLYLRMPLPYDFSYRGVPLSLSVRKVQAHLGGIAGSAADRHTEAGLAIKPVITFYWGRVLPSICEKVQHP